MTFPLLISSVQGNFKQQQQQQQAIHDNQNVDLLMGETDPGLADPTMEYRPVIVVDTLPSSTSPQISHPACIEIPRASPSSMHVVMSSDDEEEYGIEDFCSVSSSSSSAAASALMYMEAGDYLNIMEGRVASLSSDNASSTPHQTLVEAIRGAIHFAKHVMQQHQNSQDEEDSSMIIQHTLGYIEATWSKLPSTMGN